MQRYILTGSPGSGKTSIINNLKAKGFFCVKEAATDVITQEQTLGNSEPWKYHNFIDKIIHLQKQRQLKANNTNSKVQFYDRSPICTYALEQYLGFQESPYLTEEIKRIKNDNIYKRQVFFLENLGFIKNTQARKISYQDALKFEKIHLDAYIKFGYNIIKIKPASIFARTRNILLFISK